MTPSPVPYRGRFAPSPTGPLHLGSLIAALASYLDARHHDGAWLLRMEDLDPPREEAGAADSILTSLRHHGLHWDEPAMFQSERQAAYGEALAALQHAGVLFHCTCTRAMLGANGACTGRCREQSRPTPDKLPDVGALRAAVPVEYVVEFLDTLQGPQRSAIGIDMPDFVVRRKDGLFAYQLAVVVDDHAQGVTQVVRGADLLDSTPKQIFLQQALGYATPTYCHLPVICASNGQKYSKQNNAPPLDNTDAADNLRRALNFLGQPAPPTALQDIQAILAFACTHWSTRGIPAVPEIPASALGLAP